MYWERGVCSFWGHIYAVIKDFKTMHFSAYIVVNIIIVTMQQ